MCAGYSHVIPARGSRARDQLVRAPQAMPTARIENDGTSGGCTTLPPFVKPSPEFPLIQSCLRSARRLCEWFVRATRLLLRRPRPISLQTTALNKLSNFSRLLTADHVTAVSAIIHSFDVD